MRNFSFLLPAIFFLLNTHICAQIPYDRCVLDSLLLLKPPQNSSQHAEILIATAQLIWDSLPEKAQGYLKTAEKIATAENNKQLEARIKYVSGTFFHHREQFFYAQENYLAARSLYARVGDSMGMISVYISLGNLSMELENIQKAENYFRQAMELASIVNNEAETAKIHNFLATVNQLTGDTVKAMHHFREALEIYRKNGDEKNGFYIRSNIGTLLMDQKRFTEALRYFKGLIRQSKTSNALVMSVLYTRIGHIYQQLGQYQNSLLYNYKALALRRQGEFPSFYNSSLINIAGDYFLLDRPDSGLYYVNKGVCLARQMNQKKLILNGYRHLYTYYQRKGRYDKAIEYFRIYAACSDSMVKERNYGYVSIVEADQLIQRMEESNAFLTGQNKIQTLALSNQKLRHVFVRFLVVGSLVFLIIVLIGFFYNRKARQNLQAVYLRLTYEKSEKEVLLQRTLEQEQQYRFLSENSIDFITMLTDKDKRSYASQSSLGIYGYTPGEMLQKGPYDLIHPDFIPYCEQIFLKMLKTRTEGQFIYKARKSDGSFFWVESVMNPIFDPITGEIKEVVGVTRDIQERKNNEFKIMESIRQKENLLKEIHHRVKNNFAILVSLTNMQIDQSENPEVRQSLINLQLRIRTMALVHEMLYRSKDLEKISIPDYLRSLASMVTGTYNRRDIQVSVEADEAVMDIESAIPLGLIINEILSNAFKHAFPGDKAGNVWIRLENHRDGNFYLTIRDDGIGLPDLFIYEKTRTMGLQIVQILEKQLEGKVTLENNHGTLFTISYPIRQEHNFVQG